VSGETALYRTRKEFAYASNLADRLMLRVNTAEAAQAVANAKHQELLIKYGNLVAKWHSFIQFYSVLSIYFCLSGYVYIFI